MPRWTTYLAGASAIFWRAALAQTTQDASAHPYIPPSVVFFYLSYLGPRRGRREFLQPPNHFCSPLTIRSILYSSARESSDSKDFFRFNDQTPQFKYARRNVRLCEDRSGEAYLLQHPLWYISTALAPNADIQTKLARLNQSSGASTPARNVSPTSDSDSGYIDLKRASEEERRKEQTWKRKKAQRIIMMPSHLLKSTAKVLELELSCIYLPDVLLVGFNDNLTSTSNVKSIKRRSSIDLQK
ncbi:hypothetical protein D9615_010266 [Tricholomella constricta]|uniref:Uncharacterized protein n=1 Tax=Tricholomella constricta TaxID=117010 RepID=A0A8H5GM97_9AGAR|nr:hypothetical protein D9615_010266 [Tricholomella constricta]